MAVQTQFLPYAHRYQDSTAGLRDALTGIQQGLAAGRDAKIKEGALAIKQQEADHLQGQRAFLQTYSPTYSRDMLDEQQRIAFDNLWDSEENVARRADWDEGKIEQERQKLLAASVDGDKVTGAAFRDMVSSGYFTPDEAIKMASGFGSGHRTRADQLDIYGKDITAAKNQVDLAKYLVGGGTRAGGAAGLGGGLDGIGSMTAAEQRKYVENLKYNPTNVGPKGNRVGQLPIPANNTLDTRESRWKALSLPQSTVDVMMDKGLVTYNPNQYMAANYEKFKQFATEKNKLRWTLNGNKAGIAQAGVIGYTEWLKEMADGGPIPKAMDPAVIENYFATGVKKGWLIDGNEKAKSPEQVSEDLQEMHMEMLEGRQALKEATIKYAQEHNFDFYGMGPEYEQYVQDRGTGMEGASGLASSFQSQQLGGQAPAAAPQGQLTPQQMQQVYSVPANQIEVIPYNDTAGFQGFGAGIDNLINAASQEFGVDVQTMRGIGRRERGWYGRDSKTGAIGFGQMIKSTWDELAKTPEGQQIGMTPIGDRKGTAQDPRRDMVTNIRATALLTRQNVGHLEKAGLPVNAETLYVLHNMGTQTIPVLKGGSPKDPSKFSSDAGHNGLESGDSPQEFLNKVMADFRTHYAEANGSFPQGGSFQATQQQHLSQFDALREVAATLPSDFNSYDRRTSFNQMADVFRSYKWHVGDQSDQAGGIGQGSPTSISAGSTGSTTPVSTYVGREVLGGGLSTDTQTPPASTTDAERDKALDDASVEQTSDPMKYQMRHTEDTADMMASLDRPARNVLRNLITSPRYEENIGGNVERKQKVREYMTLGIALQDPRVEMIGVKAIDDAWLNRDPDPSEVLPLNYPKLPDNIRQNIPTLKDITDDELDSRIAYFKRNLEESRGDLPNLVGNTMAEARLRRNIFEGAGGGGYRGVYGRDYADVLPQVEPDDGYSVPRVQNPVSLSERFSNFVRGAGESLTADVREEFNLSPEERQERWDNSIAGGWINRTRDYWSDSMDEYQAQKAQYARDLLSTAAEEDGIVRDSGMREQWQEAAQPVVDRSMDDILSPATPQAREERSLLFLEDVMANQRTALEDVRAAGLGRGSEETMQVETNPQNTPQYQQLLQLIREFQSRLQSNIDAGNQEFQQLGM